jgi:hypothetical protein
VVWVCGVAVWVAVRGKGTLRDDWPWRDIAVRLKVRAEWVVVHRFGGVFAAGRCGEGS